MIPIMLIGIASFSGLLAAGATAARRRRPEQTRSKRFFGLVSLGDDPDVRAALAAPADDSRRPPDEVLAILALLEDGQASPAMTLRAAELASLAGFEPLADKLTERAAALATIDLGEVMPRGDGDGDGVTGGIPAYASPIHEATDPQWSVFLEGIAGGTPGERNQDGTLGKWRIDRRQLRDLDLMNADMTAWKTADGSDRSTTAAPGESLEELDAAFLADEGAQYVVLAQVIARHYDHVIADEARTWLGREIDGKTVTLSGLLALARKAGLSGMRKWLGSEADRAKVTRTTAVFDRCNGIF